MKKKISAHHFVAKQPVFTTLFEQQAAQTPQAHAVVHGKTHLTYETLNHRANLLTNELLNRGISTDHIVALLCRRNPEFLCALLAIFKAGAAYLPLDPKHPRERQWHILRHSGVKVVVLAAEFKLQMIELLQEIPTAERPLILVLEEIGNETPFHPGPNLPNRATLDDLAYVIYTSGSTGKPKGAMVEQKGMLNHLHAKKEALGIGATDRIVQNASQCFDISVWQFLNCLLVGGCVYIADDEIAHEPDKLLAYTADHKITLLEVVPSLLQGMLAGIELSRVKKPALESLRYLIVTGEALLPQLARRWFLVYPHIPLLNAYGPTECSDDITHYFIHEPPAADMIFMPIGKAIINTRLYVVKEADGTFMPCQTGEPGELWVAGGCVGRGYLNSSLLTAQAFPTQNLGDIPESRIYRSGDLVRLRTDGNIEFLGRIDRQVKVQGFRVELGEIENQMLAFPGITQCVVKAVDSSLLRTNLVARQSVSGSSEAEKTHTRLVAYFVSTHFLPSGPLRKELSRHLPYYMVPSQFINVAVMPLNANGKIDYNALPDPESMRPNLEQDYMPPRDELEKKLALIWQEVLKIPTIGIWDNFFEVGGDSLLAMQILNRLRATLHLDIPYTAIYEKHTIAELAQFIHQEKGSTSKILPPLCAYGPREKYPLTFAQKRIWFVCQMQKGNPFYNFAGILYIKGTYQPKAFNQVWLEILHRHVILTARFAAEEGLPVQTFVPPTQLDIPVLDLRTFPLHLRDAQLTAHTTTASQIPFDLETEPLIRFQLYLLQDNQFALLLVMHEIILDGWGTCVLLNEFGRLYDGAISGLSPQLPPVPVQFSDFAIWEEAYLDKAVWLHHELYWRQKLAGQLPILALPNDYPRPAYLDYKGGSVGVLVHEELSGQIKELADLSNVTLFTVLSATFKLLLHYYSGQDDIIVGAPIVNRNSKETENMVGFQINMVAFRTLLAGNPSFLELLARESQTISEAITHADYPFIELLETINPVRDATLSPIFQVMFNMLNFPYRPEPLQNVELVFREIETQYTKYDISFYGQEQRGQIYLQFSYLLVLFQHETIQRMMTNFETLLHSVVYEPNARLAHLTFLSEMERSLLLETFNSPDTVLLPDADMVGLFHAQVSKTPDAVVYICAEHTMTYSQLDHLSTATAIYLKKKGCLPDDVLGLYTRQSLALVIGIWGILKLGAAYVPLDPFYPETALLNIVKDVNLKHIIIGDVESAFPSFAGVTIRLDEVPAKKKPLLPTPMGDRGKLLFNILYTSSSTGMPKGVLIPQSAVLNRLAWMWRVYPFCATDVLLFHKSFALVGASWELLGGVLAGIPTVLISREEQQDVAILCQHILKQRVSYFLASPPLLDALEQYISGQAAPLSLKSLRITTTSSEPISPQLVSRWHHSVPNAPLINLYGLTECSSNIAVYHTLAMEPQHTHVPLGKSLDNVTIHIFNAYNTLAPVGVVGEICIAGACLALGYLNNPELTHTTFTPPVPELAESSARLFHSGDFGRWNSLGFLEYMGRRDEQVKIHGYRIELLEVEQYIMKHPSVKKAAVTTFDAATGCKELVAYVVGGADLNVQGIRSFLETFLPRYMIPTLYIKMAQLPVTPNGKVDKKNLPISELVLMATGAQYCAPRDTVEETMAHIWETLLERQPIGIRDNFFHIGGHSLKASQLAAVIQKQLQVTVPLRLIFQHPTIESLTAKLYHLDKKSAQTPSVPLGAIEASEEKEYYPLSPGQTRLYFTQKMDETLTVYNRPMVTLLTGELNINRLHSAFSQLIQRHESLRSAFLLLENTPVQRIYEEVDFQLERYDVTSSSTAPESDAMSLIHSFVRPFDLSRVPLVRVGLIKIAPTSFILIVDIHHIAADGTAQQVLNKEFTLLYQGQDLPPQHIHYRDYVRWWFSTTLQESISRQQQYWVHQFPAAIPVLTLPYDYPRPVVQSFAGGTLTFQLDEAETAALNELAQAEEMTLFMVLLSIYTIFLAKLSQQDDIVVGVPIAGRRHADVENIIGMFINTLPLRFYPSGEKRLGDFLLAVKEKTLAAFENQDYQYEELVEQLDVTRDTGRNPLFDTLFTLQNFTIAAVELPGLTLTPYPYDNKTSKFDFSIIVLPIDNTLSFTFEYCLTLFNPDTIQRFIAYFKNIITGFLENTFLPISALEIIPPLERARLLDEFNATTTPYPDHKTIHELFFDQSQRTPDTIALVFPRALSFTYQELNKQADLLAHHLFQSGLTPDTLVALLLEPSPPMIIAMLAILKAGGAYLPLAIAHPVERLKFILNDSRPHLLLTVTPLLPNLDLFPQEKILLLDQPLPPSDMYNPPIQNFPHHLAYVLYTSGTTGLPKGVLVEHRNVVNVVCWFGRQYQLQPGVRVLLMSDYTFDASVNQIFGSVLHGVSLYVPDKELLNDLDRLRDYIRDSRINLINFVPQLLFELLGHKHKLPDLCTVISGAETLEETIKDTLLKKGYALYNQYGPTETTIDVLSAPCSPAPVTLGTPIANVQVYILDQYQQLVPIGVPGELVVAGAGVARGYLNRTELTTTTFIPDFIGGSENKLYRTGDLVCWRPDGQIHFLGRMDMQVKIRGFRIELGEIENQLLTHPEIKEAVVLAHHRTRGETTLCAYIIFKETTTPPQPGDTFALREYLSQRLPDYMVPTYFVLLDAMPRTPQGKLKPQDLPDPDFDSAPVEHVPPRSKIELQLADIWSQILPLKKEAIGIHDNFFARGGHSLKAMVLVSKIHRELNVKVPLGKVFQYQTLHQLARYIQDAVAVQYSGILPIEEKEYYPLSSAQKRLYFLQQLDPTSTGYNMPMLLPLGKGIVRDKLERVLIQLIARHQSLRTSFERVHEEVVQRIHPAQSIVFTLDYYEADETSFPAIIADYIRPFDLSRAPLLRSGLIARADGNFIWLVDVHHIVSDGTSHTILTEDFILLYEGQELAPLLLQYRDFATWQNRLFASGEILTQQQYWLQLYAGDIPRLNLATDYKRPDVFTFKGDYCSFILEPAEAVKFKAFGARLGSTLYMNILAALNTLFYKYTGQTDIIIGSGTAGRRHTDLQGVVGMFVNTLTMRNYPSGAQSYEQFLKEVITTSVTAFENQDVQFEELVEKLDPERDPSRNPLFDVSMVVQNFRRVGEGMLAQDNINYAEVLPLAEEDLPDLQKRNATAKFDLTFFVSEAGTNLSIGIQYYTGIFKEATIQRLITHFKNVIHAINQNPSISLKEIEIISRAEKQQIMDTFNATTQDFPSAKTISQLFTQQVEKTPHRIVLSGFSLQVGEQVTLTYQELSFRALQLAHYLVYEKNLQSEEPVGILLPHCVERPIAILGALLAGAAYVPLDPLYPRERIKTIINDARIGSLFSSKNYLNLLNRLLWECEFFHSYLCIDSFNILQEAENEQNQLMDEALWEHVGQSATDDITGGGWVSSYTGQPFSRQEMDEYSHNILTKLEPILHNAMRVLEIGCASGITMFQLAPRVGFYYGTDLSHVIIESNQKRVLAEGLQHITLRCLAAHEVDALADEVPPFELIIINSVIQCFHGYNYLRQVIDKAIRLLGAHGYLFIGDIMDLEKKEAMVQHLLQFKQTHHDKNYITKTDFSTELFVPKVYWQDLAVDTQQITTLDFTPKLHTIENELTRYRYDLLITINTHKTSSKPTPKKKNQDDLSHLSSTPFLASPSQQTPNTLAYIIFTSGTTGVPKGIAVEHVALVNLCYWALSYYHITPVDHATLYAGVGFDASVLELFPYLICGASLTVIPESQRLDVSALNQYFERQNITISYLPTQFCQQFTEETNRSLRILLTGGDQLHGATPQPYQLHNNYGPTENTVVTTCGLIDLNHIHIGKPISNNQVYVLNPESLQLQPIGIPGELYIAGTGLARGYLNNPQLTQDTFYSLPPTKLYKTGDLTRWCPDGNLEFLQRIDQQVKVRGYRIELGEIEHRLLAHPNIKEAIVLDRPTGDREKYLCAYIVLFHPEAGIDPIKQHLASSLPHYMVPTQFVLLASLPLTPNGKVDRKLLLRHQETPDPLSSEDLAPGSALEKQVAAVWQDVLHIEPIGLHKNFFEIGGNSISILKVQVKLKKLLGQEIPVVKLFKYPTIHTLAHYLETSAAGITEELALAPQIQRGQELLKERLTQQEPETQNNTTAIAVIGMAGIFPGANNVAEFWENVKNGIESIVFFSPAELEAAGVAPALLQDPNFIKAGGFLQGIEYFDPAFFNYTPREAAIMDPQMRIFHQCVWNTLEDGGYDPYTYPHRIGLYAGSSPNLNWELLTMFSVLGPTSRADRFQALQLRDKDFICSRVSYKLNLKGPSFSVQTACSTSLVAVHLAVQGLLNGECEMALAGGVTISFPPKNGYLFQPGMVSSPDGHCRAFDIYAQGTVGGNGAAVLLLKRFTDAQRDHDNIHAIIRGSAINNDGFRKVSYTAPSVLGQAEVIRAALTMAGVPAESISYIETHGTATELGDPVEIEALKLAFNTSKKQFCGIGSVKTNIGHLDTAAGAAGLIKTILALKHRVLPPSLHFHAPNAKLGIADSPFYVLSQLTPWLTPGNLPRRAGVSSLGIGGTNAHVIVEEFSAPIPRRINKRPHRLLLLSARTRSSLQRVTDHLLQHVQNNPGLDFANLTYTLQAGRHPMPYRKITVCSDLSAAVENLSSPLPGKVTAAFCPEATPGKVVFLFPSQGSQYVNMGFELYQTEPVFRAQMDRCFAILLPLMGVNLKEILYPTPSSESAQPQTMHAIFQIKNALPLIFTICYALAQLLITWGITPFAMMGHSIGEYVAACLAGVFSLEEALAIVVTRGQLMQRMPGGAMLSVNLPAAQLEPLLLTRPEISLAAINSSSLCVLSGPREALEIFGLELMTKGCEIRPLHTSHAGHSPLLDPILDTFAAKVKQITLNKPQIPYISNLSGTWITADEVLNPSYWSRHLRHTVQFSAGLDVLLKEENVIFIEVGPGRTLTTMLNHHDAKKPAHVSVNLMRHPRENVPDDLFFLQGIGQLWLYGLNLHWSQLFSGETIKRISLPGYPFEKTRYWLDESVFQKALDMLPTLAVTPPIPETEEKETSEMSAGVILEEYQPPRNEFEKKITRLWQEVLGFEQIGIYHNFFHLNGDSLTATQVISRIKELFMVEVPLKDFFAEPTIASLAQRVKALLVDRIKNLSPAEKKKLAGQS